MRTQIFTADIVNLEIVDQDEEGIETRTPLIVPNVEGEMTLGAKELSDLSDGLSAVSADSRLIVIASPDVVPAFYDEVLSDYFDPIERVADIEAGNIGSINGLQVVRGLSGDQPYVAVAEVRDADTVEVIHFKASAVKL